MTAHRAINWALAALIAAILSCSYLLDGPSDHSAEHAQALALKDAQKQEAADERFAQAAAAMCGPNAAAKDLGDSTVQCYTHKGRKTIKVSL
jgi:hypothetical protein